MKVISSLKFHLLCLVIREQQRDNLSDCGYSFLLLFWNLLRDHIRRFSIFKAIILKILSGFNKLSIQECYVQNTAREYAKIYAAETQPLEGFGEVPEIIPIFLIHRPQNNIPYATVEEELIGEFVKYSVKDGKEINFMRKDSEAGQKCCTFQHWVYEKTSGSLLVTDMQDYTVWRDSCLQANSNKESVGMKLTDVGIATPAK
ncbi:hypothetical protein L345_13151, partial [Ophiophagus hannah]